MFEQKITTETDTTELPTAKVVHEIKLPLSTVLVIGAALIGGFIILARAK